MSINFQTISSTFKSVLGFNWSKNKDMSTTMNNLYTEARMDKTWGKWSKDFDATSKHSTNPVEAKFLSNVNQLIRSNAINTGYAFSYCSQIFGENGQSEHFLQIGNDKETQETSQPLIGTFRDMLQAATNPNQTKATQDMEQIFAKANNKLIAGQTL